jgi:hypothetical protein
MAGTPIPIVLLACTLALGGCARRAGTPPAHDTRVGVVDLQTVSRAHPRWPELEEVMRQLQEVEAELATLPPPLSLPSTDLQRLLEEEANRLQAELAREVEFIRQNGLRRLETFAAALRSRQEARLAQTQREVQMQAERELMARREEIRARLRTAEQEIREEYRFAILNLRLRAEVAGLASEEEGRQLLAQLQGLQQEREDRIQRRVEEMDGAFAASQRAKEAEVNATLRAAQEVLQAEFQRQLVARERSMQADVGRAAAEREREFRDRLARRQQELLRTADTQLRNRQGVHTDDARERASRLTVVLAGLRDQRQRLEDRILAEVKIEVATIAQDRRLDVVLTRFVANVAGVDITPAVVEKLKR